MDGFPATQELRTSRYVVSWREKEGAEEAGLYDAVKKKAAMEILIHIVGGSPLYSSAASWLYKLTVDPSSIGMTTRPLPVFTFDFKHKYPEGMGCVLYEKKLYFMGGSTAYVNSYKSDGKTIDQPVYMKALDDLCNYPPTVYVFDCQTSKLLNHNCFVPNMTTGKSEEPFTFVFDHVLYVLSSRLDMPPHVTFEAFHFNQRNKFWTKLTPLPDFNRIKFGQVAYGSALNRTSGEFLVSFGDRFDACQQGICLLSYNISSGRWRRLWTVKSPYSQSMTLDVLRPSTMPYFNRDSVFAKEHLYTTFQGPLCRHLMTIPVLKYGPLITPDDVKDYTKLKPVDQTESHRWQIYPYQSEDGVSSRYLIHIADDRFGYLEVFDHYSFLVEKVSPCILRFVAFEDTGDESCRRVPYCFRVNTLYSCDFYLTANKNEGHINAAFVMPA